MASKKVLNTLLQHIRDMEEWHRNIWHSQSSGLFDLWIVSDLDFTFVRLTSSTCMDYFMGYLVPRSSTCMEYFMGYFTLNQMSNCQAKVQVHSQV